MDERGLEISVKVRDSASGQSEHVAAALTPANLPATHGEQVARVVAATAALAVPAKQESHFDCCGFS